jgi:hypothetical protein
VRRLRLAIALLVVLLATAVVVVEAREGDDDNRISRVGSHARPPVVIVVLDEFSTDTLTRPDGTIDAERYPNFAELASSSTWFRNGHTIYDSTFKAVPAILDARYPKRGTAPDVRSHQPSIFHLMDGLGYNVIRVESGTAVCPPKICPGVRTRRPGVLKRLAGGGRPARLHKWIGAIRRRPTPTFYFHHALLPHEPWIYLPSGHQSRPKGEDPIGGVNRPIGFHDPGLTDHNHLRHLLQVGYTDHELGRLLDRLHRTRMFRDTLLIVLADHGYSFELDVQERRQVTETNIEQIAPVPFFVKAPGQTTGKIDDSLVRSIDVVPTVADLLDVSVPWRNDGYSAFSEVTRARHEVAVPRRDFSRVISVDRDEFARRRHDLRVWRAAKFGTGAQSELMFGDPWASAYRIGPHPELIGRAVPAATVARSRAVHGAIANARLLADVEPDEQVLPTRVTGRLEGSPPDAVRDLAVVVNGRVRAVGRSFHLRGRRAEYFSLMLPETALRRGRNRLQLMEVRPGGGLVWLATS